MGVPIKKVMVKISGAFSSALLFVSVLLAPFSPFPIAALGYRFHPIWSLASVFIAIFIIAIGFGAQNAAAYGIWVGPLALMMGFGYKIKWAPDKTALVATLVSILSLFIFLNMAAFSRGMPVSALMEDLVFQSLNQLQKTKDLMQKEGKNSPALESEFMKKALASPKLAAKELSRSLLPVILILFAVAAWLNTILMVNFVERLKKPKSWRKGYLLHWRSPDWLIWVAIALGSAWIFNLELGYGAVQSASMLLLLVYYIQGMSIMAFFVNRLNLVAPIRIVLYLMASYILFPAIAGMGFFDFWWDLRARFNSQNEDRSGDPPQDPPEDK